MAQIGNEARLMILLARERKERIFDREVKHGRDYLVLHPNETEELKQKMWEQGLAAGLDLYERLLAVIVTELEGV